MKLSVALRLGRISNIPTVWSNTLAGVVIAGGEAWRVTTLLTAIGISLLYISGMYLNDAFDSDFDARERPERPIPAGLASQSTVFATGFGLMLVGLGFILWASSAGVLKDSWRPVLLSLLLAATVLFYNWHHKGNPISPIVMGLCRALIYVVAGYTVAETPSPDVFIIAFTTFCYLIGLTFAAKQETLIRFELIVAPCPPCGPIDLRAVRHCRRRRPFSPGLRSAYNPDCCFPSFSAAPHERRHWESDRLSHRRHFAGRRTLSFKCQQQRYGCSTNLLRGHARNATMDKGDLAGYKRRRRRSVQSTLAFAQDP